MKRMIRDVLRSLIWQEDEAETPKYIHDLVLLHHSVTLQIRLIYEELLTEYKWLHCILKNASTETLNIANIALLFCHSAGITFLMSDQYNLTDFECITLMEGLILMKEIGLETTVRLQWPSEIPASTRTKLRSHVVHHGVLAVGTIQCHHHDRAVSFKLNEAHIGLETQQQFTSRIEHLIAALKDVKAQQEPESPKQIAAESRMPDTSKIFKRDISLSFQLTVAGYCRKIILEVLLKGASRANDVQDLILFFYAKPMQMNVMKLGSDTYETVLICPLNPLLGNWNFVTKQLLHSNDQTHALRHVFRNAVNNDSDSTEIRRSDWKMYRWNEMEDYFKVVEDLKCRFCEVSLNASNKAPVDFSLGEGLSAVCVAAECLEKRRWSCDLVLECGHNCIGLLGHDCIECMHPCCATKNADLNHEDFCNICWVKPLRAAPCVELQCGHYFHFMCLWQKIDRKWPGARITFEFLNCPLCEQEIHHPALDDITNKYYELKKKIARDAMERVEIDGIQNDQRLQDPNSPFFYNLEKFAMDRLVFYKCFKCNKPYFGGMKAYEEVGLEETENYKAEQLVCDSCTSDAQ